MFYCGVVLPISAKLGCGKSKTDSPVHNNSNNLVKDNGKMAGNSLFPAANSQQRLGTGASSPLARSKIALKPGRSLMDWIRLGRSNKDLTGVGGEVLNVSVEELSKHDKADDAWIAIRGRVYNISPYLEYHPGGVDELMRGAGVDATQLFDEIHKWVNAESMLEKCYVGKLETESPASVKGLLSRKGSNHSQTLGPNGAIDTSAAFKTPDAKTPTYDWFQSSKVVTLVVYTRWKNVHEDHVTIDKTSKNLRVAVAIEKHTFKIHLELHGDVTEEYTVKVHPDSGKVEIVLPKGEPDKQWSSLGKPLRGDKSYIKTFQAETVYRECTVRSIEAVTHDVILLTVQPPQGCRLPVPIGHHVQIKHKVSGMEVARSYTAVLPSLYKDRQDPNLDQGRVIYLMIKIYPNGAVTPFIGTLNVGDQVCMSDNDGSFDVSRLAGVTHLVMLAAGTGFTPMVRLIYHTVMDAPSDSTVHVHLLFYNKKACDIMWREELDTLASSCSRFKVTYILSDETSWDGLKGRVCADHIRQFVPLLTPDPVTPATTATTIIVNTTINTTPTLAVNRDSTENDTTTTTTVNDAVNAATSLASKSEATPSISKSSEKQDGTINPLVCVCGPTPFTNSATQLLKDHGLANKHIYLFQG